jgi:ankyrin repeat protein
VAAKFNITKGYKLLKEYTMSAPINNDFTVIHSPQTSLLIFAVFNNKPHMAEEAIKFGANVNVTDKEGNTLLHICPNDTIGQILISGGAEVNVANNQKVTPLHSSMRRGIIPLTLLLINNNADVKAQEADGTAPLHLAESTDVNNALLAKKPNVNVQNSAGDTPLHLAIRIKGSPIVIPLVQAGAATDILNKLGNTAVNEVSLLIQQRQTELQAVVKAVLGSQNELTCTLNPATSNTAVMANISSAGGVLHALALHRAASNKASQTQELHETAEADAAKQSVRYKI